MRGSVVRFSITGIHLLSVLKIIIANNLFYDVGKIVIEEIYRLKNNFKKTLFYTVLFRTNIIFLLQVFVYVWPPYT